VVGAVSGDALVAFRQVSYARGGRRILDRLSLELRPGETLVLLGRSGSGKTTALKMVNGLLTPDTGEVTVEGKPTTEWDPIRLRRMIGYVIQEAGLFPHYTVARNVGLVPGLEGWEKAAIEERTRELLREVGLDPAVYAGRYPRELSGGQRQRVGVARALAARPALMLLDEPFGAVDPITRHELQEQFVALREETGTAAVFVTHDVREALRIGTKIGLLDQGRLVVLASPEEFVRSTGGEARAFLACLDGGRA
jgi:osmoprotectant transport system ATP-binding protein